ncbi:hypothetical protein [Methylobacterium variabile]|jgi:hypothetical protein|nr:hypothetical protein [Methylobacterium variabile]
MSRRLIALIALAFVADAIAVHGRAPRAISIVHPEAGETVRPGRQQGSR